MKSFDYVIRDPHGVHARPGGIIVGEAKKFQSSIFISLNGRKVDLKKIFALLGLCIKCGDKVTVTIEGSDEDAALDAIQKTFVNNI